MRTFFITIALTLAASAASAQNPMPAPGKEQVLIQWRDYVLTKWEESASKTASLEAECHHYVKDKTFGTQELYVGVVRYLKSDTKRPSQASLELKKVENQKFVEGNFKKFICTGNFVYEYVPSLKVIRQHEIPQGQLIDDNALSFIFGMKAKDAVTRYDISWIPPADPKAQDPYHYLLVRPKLNRDKSDFVEARISILKENFMVRQLWFQQPNGTEIKWDLPRITAPAKLETAMFAAPSTPTGWKQENVRADLTPKIRP